MIIENGQVFTKDLLFKKQNCYVSGEQIVNNATGECIDAKGLYVIPGLIDIHLHGCMGADFCDGTPEALDTISTYLAQNGITTFAPASMTLNEEQLTGIFKNAHDYKNPKGALLMGINMEGPFLSNAKKGAQNPKYLTAPNSALFRRLNKASGHLIKLFTLAPECEGGMEAIDTLKDEVIISIGHTTANYDLASEAFRRGARHVTHLFNAMAPFTHREPGLVGAASDAENVMVELISDGVHIHPAMIRAAFKIFTDDRMVLISDSMMATGLSDGEYSLGGQAVHVSGNLATLADGTIAGSATNLMDCLRKAVSFGIPLESALKMATVNPAKVLGETDVIGSLEPGKLANIVLLDKDLNVVKVIVKGKSLEN
ncbi:MAG: N-acetylglucosamine-6-phosphate deacetylase [Eubacterium sp.]